MRRLKTIAWTVAKVSVMTAIVTLWVVAGMPEEAA